MTTSKLPAALGFAFGPVAAAALYRGNAWAPLPAVLLVLVVPGPFLLLGALGGATLCQKHHPGHQARKRCRGVHEGDERPFFRAALITAVAATGLGLTGSWGLALPFWLADLLFVAGWLPRAEASAGSGHR